MSNLILLADIHLGLKNSNKEWIDNHVDYFNNFFIPTIKTMEDHSYLIIAGDLFDNRQSLGLLTMHTVFNIFNDLSKLFKEIRIITGNHDAFFKSSNEITSLDVLKIFKNVFIYKEPEIVEIDKLKFLMLPWISDKLKEVEIIKNQSKFADYLVCHTEVKGFYYNTKIQVNEGNDISIYKDYKYVFSGHFHFRQNSKNLYYLGSPMHFTRNDINDKKGIYIFNTDSKDLNFIENNYSSEFKKIKLFDILELTIEEIKKITNNNYIDIITTDLFIDKHNINPLIKLLDNAKDIRVNVVETERKINEVVASENGKFSVIALCENYMNDNSFDNTEKEKLLNYFKKLYNKISI